MLDQTFNKLKNIQNVTELRLPLLFFSFAIWVIFPIIGIFPLLLVVQLDLLRQNKENDKLWSLNSFILVLVVLTLATYLSSFDVFADTKVYLNIYNSLDRQSPFENAIAEQRFEFILFVFFAVIHYLSNGSTFWCLFSFALFNNALITFYISKKLSPKYFPSLLIILFSSYFYYSQVFYMRQFFALIFVLAAIVSLESSIISFVIFSLLAVFSHTTSAIYILTCIFIKVGAAIGQVFQRIKWQKRDKTILYFCLAVTIFFIVYSAWQIYQNPKAIYKLANNLIEYLPQEQVSSSIQGRIENNDQRDIEVFSITKNLAAAICSLSVFSFIRSYKKISLKILSMIAFYIISLLQILFILATGFNQRIAYLFLGFFGLFFCIGLDDQALGKTNKIKNFYLISIITFLMAALNTLIFINLNANMTATIGWSFFDKQPLSMSILDYIVYFFDSV